MARWWGAAAAAALVLVMACERLSEHAMLPADLEETSGAFDADARAIDDRWKTPDPWAIDSDESTLSFGREPAGLSEFFEERPERFAHGEAGDFEWPYVWDGKDGRGMRSGYDWEGASTAVKVRGLDMPPSHDVFGELGPFPADSTRDALFPGSKVHDEVVPRYSLPMARRPRAALSQLRLQSLSPSSYTDYTMSGDGVRCVCDSAAAGDEEMEGLNPNVKPACTCTGGRRTSFTGTEEGGPLDTGAEGAWPQGLPDNGGVAYIDGGSTRAYKPLSVQSLAALPSQLERKWSMLVKLAEDAAQEDGNSTASAPEEEPADDKEDGHEAPVEDSSESDSPAEESSEQQSEDEGGEDKAEQSDVEATRNSSSAAAAEEEEEEEVSAKSPDAVAEPTWWRLHQDPHASPLDRNLVERFRRVFRLFLSDSAYCEELGDRCHGRLCGCKRRAGRHMCYGLTTAKDLCPLSKTQVCEANAVKKAYELCKDVEKLPGVNVDAVRRCWGQRVELRSGREFTIS